MKRVLILFLSVITFGLAPAAVAAAAPVADTGPNGEKAETSFTLTPLRGSFNQSKPVPAAWEMGATITEPDGKTGDQILPLKGIDIVLPKGTTFNPDKRRTKVCPDSKLNPKTNLDIPPQTAIQLCPKSVIGNGTATLYIGHVISPTPLEDPVLIVFDGGLKNGLPSIKIYGFSKGTGHGIYMSGVLQKDGTLELSVPWLTSNAAVTDFHLSIPGLTPIKYDGRTVPDSVGQDPQYLRASCPTGLMEIPSIYSLGEQTEDGTPIGPTTLLSSPIAQQACVGKADAWITRAKVKGPGKAKRGKSTTYRVTIKNAGTATAKGVKVAVKGKGAKGKANGGNIPAGKSKTVRVKVKFTKKGKSKTTFTVRSRNGGSVKAVKRITVR